MRRVDRRLLPWQSPSNSRTRNVIHRRGAHLERPAEKFLIFRFLSAKRCHLAGIFAKTHGTIPSGTQRRNDNTPGPSRLVSRHCRPRLGSRPCPAGAQDERPYEVRRKAARNSMEIPTPVCALARNDREFDKFPICRAACKKPRKQQNTRCLAPGTLQQKRGEENEKDF